MRKERYTIMILDDELQSTRMLQRLLEKIDYVEVVHRMNDPEQALDILDVHPVDILIVDMEMPTMMGWEFVGLLDKRPAILVATGHREYGFEAQDMGAIGYLPKLVKLEMLRKAIDKAIREVDYQYEQAKNDVKAIKVKNFVTKGDEIVPLEDLYYVEVDDKMLTLFLPEGQTIHIQMSMSRLMEELPDSKFVRISGKHLVGRHAVRSLHKKEVQVKERKKPLEILFPNAYKRLLQILELM